ncbi:hypothetical protein [Campylobacter sp. MIT 97-5078]|uniref:hypothetical protein n=1 Tax=Campylobacter sp. MIT 97-5078 TaxID=1548153 RepID=UPI000513425C|nr:hypothetical protein [Campylobacter sp. MIT 97-5078]KGI55806.1 hypothetical protein LR59_10435 [Campylobacter sp. MIT 97-5078]KGI57631.1 hypothetical protein LR59_02795 [Campylobacter sp. MIT 97-5078]TQR26905.1 hypothetical protein DMB91_05860 [Campylobacter sp. MIT 97-5078]
MQVDSTLTTTSSVTASAKKTSETSTKNTESLNTNELSKDNLEKLSKLGGKGITQLYVAQFQQEIFSSSFGNFSSQSGVLGLLGNFGSSADNIAKVATAFSNVDFAAIGYTGKNPLSMNQNELNALISENGFFGVENTANRIADFVIQGAGDDLEKLKKGFEGMKQGFKQAEKMWGSALPQISQDTITKAIEKVSARIEELGGNAVDIKA